MPPFFALTPAICTASKHDFGELRADGIGEADVRDQPFAEESGDAAAGAVEELIGDHEIERVMFFFREPTALKRDDALDSECFHAVDVGAEVQLRRRNAMAAAVARQEYDLFSGEFADDIVIRRTAPG